LSSPSTEEKLNIFCKEIQQLDNSIRFVGIANNLGSLIATSYRKGLIPLMNEQETSHYAIQVVLRAATREDFESKIGKLEYSIGKYERIIRATVPIRLFGSNDDQNKFYYLLNSFDLKSAVIDIIEDKVMPFVEISQMYFLICESCFWCVSSSNLHFIKNPKCPDNVKVSINSYQMSVTNARSQASAFTDSAIALECNSCNLIISDTMMPEMNGYEFVKKAKEIDKKRKQK
jgi:CheY-like chemotaxis protein